MITKKSVLVFTLSFLSVISMVGMDQLQTSIEEKNLYCAIREDNVSWALHAAETIPSPTFTIAIDGKRTVKQINALNFAIRIWEKNQDARLLATLLGSVTPSDLPGILQYVDQVEGKTPEDVFKRLFPGQYIYEFVGPYIKKTSTSMLNDERPWY